jgi:hypothetical protein
MAVIDPATGESYVRNDNGRIIKYTDGDGSLTLDGMEYCMQFMRKTHLSSIVSSLEVLIQNRSLN